MLNKINWRELENSEIEREYSPSSTIGGDYLPYINVALLVSTITFLLNPKNVVEYFILIIIVLSPATLIPLYNFNFEIFIFLMFFIIGVNRIYIINWILYLYCFLLKLYPLVSGVFILIESKKRSLNFIIGLIISLIIIASYFIFIDIKQYSSVSEYYFPIADVLVSGGKPGYWHLFGLNTIPKILKYFELNYIFSIAIVYSIFFYLLYKLIKSYYIKKLLDNENFFNYKWKLFLLGGNILLISFIFYSNWIHRELFLILLIPQLLVLNYKEKKFLNFITYFLIFRYLFLFIYAPSNLDSYYIIDNKRYFNSFFLISMSFKGILDFILMSFIGSIIIKMNFSIIKKFLISFRS